MTAVDKHLRRVTATGIMAAVIGLATAFLFHVPVGVGGGYVHLGDAFLYLTAALLPTPCAVIAAAVGGGLADILTGGVAWALPTALIKALMVLPFTAKGDRLLCRRNCFAPLFACGILVAGYGVTGWLLFGWPAALAELIPNLLQGVVNGGLFAVIAVLMDKNKLKIVLSSRFS